MEQTNKSVEILQGAIPDGQRAVAARSMPGMQPVGQRDWISCDGAYGAQLGEKARLLAADPGAVLQILPGAGAAALETLDEVLTLLRDRGDFAVQGDAVTRPDGISVQVDRANPLTTLARLLQEDICILQRQGDVHVLTAAALCFPASWRLSDKIGRPLIAIHQPVPAYDARIAARVQRLFNGVQVGQPIWRANDLRYDNPALFQPFKRTAQPAQPAAHYDRSERQTLFRLPKSGAIVFAIHTSVVKSPT